MLSHARSVLLWWRFVRPASSIVRTRRARAVEERLRLEPGDVLACALVDAHAEPHVPGRVAEQIEGVGIVPPPGIAVGRREEHQDLLALGDDVVADPDVDGGGAEEGLHRRLPAHRLVEGHPRQRGVLAQSLPLVGIGRERVEDGGQPVHRCVDARGEQGPDDERGLLKGKAMSSVDLPSRFAFLPSWRKPVSVIVRGGIVVFAIWTLPNW